MLNAKIEALTSGALDPLNVIETSCACTLAVLLHLHLGALTISVTFRSHLFHLPPVAPDLVRHVLWHSLPWESPWEPTLSSSFGSLLVSLAMLAIL